MYKIFKQIIICWVVFALSSSMAIAGTFEHLYTVSVKNKDALHLNLANNYKNVEQTERTSTYFYNNENRYYLAYLTYINNSYAYYYYLSNVDELKNTEFTKYLSLLGYQYSEIKNKKFIDMYRENALEQKYFDGKLNAIQNGTFDSFISSQKSFINNFTGKTNFANTNNYYNANNNYYATQNSYPAATNQFTTKTIPAGYSMKLLSPCAIAVCSMTNNETYTTILAEDIYVDGISVAPKGSQVVGTIRPNISRNYNNNHIDVSFDKIIKPDGTVINIRTENRSIYTTLRTQNEYYVPTSTYSNTQNTTTNTNTASSTGMSTGQKVAVGAAVVGLAALLVGAVVVGSKSSNNNSSNNTSTTTQTETKTTASTSYTPLYYSNKTPEDLCNNNNVSIEKNALIDIIFLAPALVPNV